METANESPLKKYRRQPKLFIDLPSKGNFYPQGAVYNDTFTQLAVFSMTPSDDILFKTPDALITGNATANTITSCIPSILDPWSVPSIDIDTLLVSIRLATYGPDISVSSTCPHCKNENTYDIPLQSFIDHFNSLEYNDTLKVDDFVIKTRPLTYKEYTENQKQIVAFQRALNIQAPSIEDEKQRNEYQENVVKQIAEANLKIMVISITSVEINGEVETDLQEIVNWISGTDAKIFHALKNHSEQNVAAWRTPPHKVICGNEKCEKEHSIIIRLDQSDFFGKG